MTLKTRLNVFLAALAACIVLGAAGAVRGAGPADPTGWDPKAAASYLDARAAFWATWPNAQRDHGTFCISCHTTLPFAIARPALRRVLGEPAPGAAESRIFDNLLTRARGYKEMEPFYPDQTRGIPKTSESRAIESVMNALVLVTRDRDSGHLGADSKTALSVMWSLQMKTGPQNGAWTWLNFGYEPWESPNSPYFGASMAALAVGTAPDGYASNADIQENLKNLRGYFTREFDKQSALNKLMGLWASGAVGGLITPEQKSAIVDQTFAMQMADGGWSTASIGGYKRQDGSTIDPSSDGYATALATLALQSGGMPPSDARLKKGLDWLRHHQSPTGQWVATSPNKQRDPASEPAKFMSDAATALAVLSLTHAPTADTESRR
jgi:squalene-hopene/tetraprenyl-beta-curcumene cyclase